MKNTRNKDPQVMVYAAVSLPKRAPCSCVLSKVLPFNCVAKRSESSVETLLSNFLSRSNITYCMSAFHSISSYHYNMVLLTFVQQNDLKLLLHQVYITLTAGTLTLYKWKIKRFLLKESYSESVTQYFDKKHCNLYHLTHKEGNLNI